MNDNTPPTQSGSGKKDLSTRRRAPIAPVGIHKKIYDIGIRKPMRAGLHVARMISALGHKPISGGHSPLDHFHALTKGHFKYPSRMYNKLEHEKAHFERLCTEYVQDDDLTIVFSPWDTTIDDAEGYGLIPKWGKSIVITTPGGFVNCDPLKTKQIFINVITDAKREIDGILSNTPAKKINVISYSAANGAGFYTANNLIPKDNQGFFISVVTGRGLGEEVFSSSTLHKIREDAEKMGISSGEEYNKVFYHKDWGLLLPMYNCDNLPKSTTFFIGEEDTYIPPALGMDIAHKAKATNPNVKIHLYPFGHIGTILYAAHVDNLKHTKSVIILSKELTEETVDKYQNMFAKRNLKLPRDEVRLWAAAHSILYRSPEFFNESKLIKEHAEHPMIQQIEADFLSAVLPDEFRTITFPTLKFSSRVLRGRPWVIPE